MAAFSRLQLAAALLEYDNDPDNPNGTFRSAQDSAIFSHLRPTNRARRGSGFDAASRHSTDYLGVALPSEVGGEREDVRRSRASLEALQNPFGVEIPDEEEEPEVEEELEVDLASWGLDTFMPKEKGGKGSKGIKGKGKEKAFIFPNPHPTSPVATDEFSGPKRPQHTRPMSMGDFGAGDAFLDSASNPGRSAHFRRNSIANPLDVAGMVENEVPMQRRRASSHALIETLPVRPPLHSIPSFGKQERERDTIPFPSSTPPEKSNDTGSRPPSRLDTKSLMHGRTLSNATLGTMMSKALPPEEPNPFAVRPPSPTRASRFDPKAVNHARTLSNATALSMGSRQKVNDENRQNVAIRPPSQASRLELDAKSTRTRHLSNASIGTRNMLDNDNQSYMTGDVLYGHERRYSRMDLMRPKVLIMPSPLQSIPAAPPYRQKARDGFQLSADGPPLPPAARPLSRPNSVLQSSMSLNVPVASNSFTPNPRLSLSSSQLLFRNSLMVDGKRDVTYSDIDGNIRRAEEEGEQVQLEWPEEAPAVPAAIVVVPVEDEDDKKGRPAGKLYGKSLIDDLEARKAQMRGKQRTFTGDERPSMMDRTLQRSSTLIDPASLVQTRPISQRMDSYQVQQPPNRRGSRNSKPLLNFDSSSNLGVDTTMPRGKSVFGVDTLWEREVAKLKEIEANEKIEAEEQQKRADAEEAKKARKKKKGKGKENASTESPVYQDEPEPPQPILPTLPPVLPDIPKTTTRKKRVETAPEADSDEESSSSEIQDPTASSTGRIGEVQGWASDEEEDNDGPLRTTGVGPRYPQRARTLQRRGEDDDSDEDLPLAATLQRAAQKLAVPNKTNDSDDEDRPLSTLLDKPKHNVPSINFDNLAAAPKSLPDQAGGEADDDEPLGIRMSRIPSSSRSFNASMQVGDDDDRPLAMHPEQQRRTQYQMMAQQQMMFQAQMRNTMAFGAPPSIMGSPFAPFGPPMQPIGPMMMGPPPLSFSPQPQDPAKFGRVDRWRRDVVVEAPPP